MKSRTCKGNNGQYLEEYHSKAAADIASDEARDRLTYPLLPYSCRTCGYWHLAPATTRRQCMFCTDRALFLKDIYVDKAEAQQIADQVRREKRIQLHPYKCPHGSGWHLTKK